MSKFGQGYVLLLANVIDAYILEVVHLEHLHHKSSKV